MRPEDIIYRFYGSYDDLPMAKKSRRMMIVKKAVVRIAATI